VLQFWEYRVKCPACGLQVEALPWMARYARLSTVLARWVAELCKVVTHKAVAVFQALYRERVKAIPYAPAQQARSLEGITVLGMDEIRVGKGHHFLYPGPCLPRGPENCST